MIFLEAYGIVTRLSPSDAPELTINGFSPAYLAAQALRGVGIEPICVPLHQAPASVPAGAAVFLLPEEYPLVAPRTLDVLRRAMEAGNAPALCPTRQGQRGYPLLLRGEALARAAKGDWAGLVWQEVPVEDPGICFRADANGNYVNLTAYAMATAGVSERVCRPLYDEAELPAHIRAHCEAVARLAVEMAMALIRSGYCLNIELCRAGARLHDIRRLDAPHHLKGGDWLSVRGYYALGEITRRHMGFDEYRAAGLPPDFDEATVVNLADKLVQETHRVTLRARYAPAFRAFPPEDFTGQKIRADLNLYRALAVRYRCITGQDLHA